MARGFQTCFGIKFRVQHGELGSALLLDVELEIVRMMSTSSFNLFANIYFIRPLS
jgi:hypothetical protein